MVPGVLGLHQGGDSALGYDGPALLVPRESYEIWEVVEGDGGRTGGVMGSDPEPGAGCDRDYITV